MTWIREERWAHPHLVSRNGLTSWLDVTLNRCDKMRVAKCSKSLAGTGANTQEILELVSVKLLIPELHHCTLHCCLGHERTEKAWLKLTPLVLLLQIFPPKCLWSISLPSSELFWIVSKSRWWNCSSSCCSTQFVVSSIFSVFPVCTAHCSVQTEGKSLPALRGIYSNARESSFLPSAPTRAPCSPPVEPRTTQATPAAPERAKLSWF